MLCATKWRGSLSSGQSWLAIRSSCCRWRIYSSDEVRARIVFPIDFDAIHRYEPDDSLEQNLWAGRKGIFPVRVVAYNPSLFAEPEFTVIARDNGWLARCLAADGFRLDDSAPDSAWQQLGGVFTPMAHDGTGLMQARSPSR